jgi:hypothetical protein
VTQLADALLEAHVQHVLAAWHGDAAARTIAERVSSLFAWFGEVKLDQVATRAQVMGLIQRHVIELRASGGITELAGELSQLVFSSRKSAATRLDQVLTDEEYGEFADKVIALEGVRRGLIALVAQSEAFGVFRTRVIARTLSALVFRRAGLRDVTGRLLPALEQRVTGALTRYFERRERAPLAAERELLELVDPEWLRSLIDEIWAALAPKQLSETFAFIGGQDLEDFVVLGYEFWLRYRRSDYFREIMEEMVDHFFAKYGRLSLAELLEDMGVDEPMIARELDTFLVPLLDEAARSGFLEQQIRASLGAFYRSPAVEALLASKPRASD